MGVTEWLGIKTARRQDIGYGLLAVSVLPSTLFNMFHMRAFVLRGLTAADVATAHSVYFAWNMANDVFAGYWIDRFCAVYGTRLPLIRYLSFVWVVVSVLPFVDLSLSPLVHYFLCIMLFDGCMTVVCIARGSLVAELGDNEQHRLVMQRVQSLVALPEGIVNLVALSLWDRPAAFNTLLVFSMCLSVVLVESGYRLCRPGVKAVTAAAGAKHMPHVSLGSFCTQLRGQANFWAFVGMNCIMEMEGTFHGEFNVILVEVLAPAASGAMPVVLQIIGFLASFGATLLADRLGSFKVCYYAILGKVFACLVALVLVKSGFPLAVFTVQTMILVQASMSSAQRFFDVTVANLADEYNANCRRKGLSETDVTSRMFATHAMFAKPLNSAASVISTQVFALVEYREMKALGAPPPPVLQAQATRLLLGFPLVVGVFQFLSWRKFTPHGRELQEQQQLRSA